MRISRRHDLEHQSCYTGAFDPWSTSHISKESKRAHQKNAETTRVAASTATAVTANRRLNT